MSDSRTAPCRVIGTSGFRAVRRLISASSRSAATSSKQFFVFTSRKHGRLVHHSYFAFHSYYKYKHINIGSGRHRRLGHLTAVKRHHRAHQLERRFQPVLILMKWFEAPLKLMGWVMTFDGAEMNESPVPCGADVDELVVVVTRTRSSCGERVGDAFWRPR